MAYVLGFIVADGALIKSKRGTHFLEIQSIDKEILYRIRDAFESDLRIGEYQRKNPNWNKIYRLQIGSKKIFTDLERLGLSPRKSLNVELPTVPPDHFASFLRGYFDGDGNIAFRPFKKESQIKRSRIVSARFTSGSEKLLSQIKHRLGEALGTSGSLFYYSRAWRLNYGADDSKKLYVFMYLSEQTEKGQDLICLNRKRIIYQRAFLQP